MFTLAHLSDPHLAPLPKPRLTQLFGKRLTGYVNWQRKRRFVHDPAVLAKITADMAQQAPDHIAVTGDLANIGLPDEFLRGREWLQTLGSARDVSFVLGNHDVYVNDAIQYAARSLGPLYDRRRRQRRLSLSAPARTSGAGRPLERGSDRAVIGDRARRQQAAHGTRRHSQRLEGRKPVPRGDDPSSAGQRRRRA